MTASLIGSWDATASAATSVLVTPTAATIQEGDLLIAVVARSASGVPSAPSGWTGATLAGLKNSDTNLSVFSGSAPTGGSAVFWKVATGSEPSDYEWTGTSANWGLVVMAFRDVEFPLRGGVVDNDWIFESCTDTRRSGSTLIGANGGLCGSDAPRSRYLMIATFTQNITGVAANLGLPLGSTLTEVANLSIVGCSTLVAYELIDLATDPSMGGGNRYCETDQSTGSGRGWLFLVVDDDTTLDLVEVPDEPDPGPAPDVTPPVVTVVSPTPGTPIPRDQEIVVDVTDNSGIRRFVLHAEFQGLNLDLVCHDGSRFGRGFQVRSTATPIVGGTRYRIRPDRAWPDMPRFTAIAIDTGGNEAS